MTKLREDDVMYAKRRVEGPMGQGGWSIRAAAQWLGVDESTLRYRLKRQAAGTSDGRRGQQEACAPLAGVIEAWIEAETDEDERRPSEPVKALYERLVAEHGYTGSYRAVLRFVKRRWPRGKRRVRRRVELAPGAQGQVDWVVRDVQLDSDGGWVRLLGLVIVLAFSRGWAVIWRRAAGQLDWLAAHNGALERLGGVPTTLRIDNLKTGVSQGAGPWGRINAVYQSYLDQLGTVAVDPALPRRGDYKGKVERRNRDLTTYLDLGGQRFRDIEHLQLYTDARTRERMDELTNPLTGSSITEALTLERQALSPLPVQLPTPFDTQVSRRVDDQALVRFEGREYHVPFAYAGRQVTVRGGAGEVTIHTNGQCLARYPRGTACRRLIRQDFYEGPSTDTVEAPTPLGRWARALILNESWRVPTRAIDHYAEIVEGR